MTINGDLSQRASAHTGAMEWSPSPSGTVWRKRLHLVGAAESGQVTSVVRYQPDSSFPSHDHPDGEEILVLDGVFSDEAGDWPAGTYLLNPEGFRHAPFSAPGCLLFVKLRQYPGTNRSHVSLSTADQRWEQTSTAGVERKILYEQPGFTDTVRLERWQPGAQIAERALSTGTEILVVEGSFTESGEQFDRHDWLRLPAGATLAPTTADGCTVYIKEGGFDYLRAG